MDKDLLGNDFTEKIDISRIDKSITLSKIVILIGTIYSILEIGRWLRLFLLNKAIFLKSDNFYYVLLFVFATIPITVMFFLSWIWYLNANRLIKHSIQNNDYALFNKAYTIINKSTTLSIIGTSISLLSLLISIAFD